MAVSTIYLKDSHFGIVGSTIDIIRHNNNGSIDIVSDNPDYTEINHHFTFVYYSPNRNYENFNDNRLIASGSKLTDIHMPAGYKDTNLSWIDVEPCESVVAIPPVRSTRNGPDYKVATKHGLYLAIPIPYPHFVLASKVNGQQ